MAPRGTPALHLNEPNWIIDGFNELIVDFLSQLALFLDPTQLQPLKNPKQNHQGNTIAIPNQAQGPRPATEQLQTAGSFKRRAGVPL